MHLKHHQLLLPLVLSVASAAVVPRQQGPSSANSTLTTSPSKASPTTAGTKQSATSSSNSTSSSDKLSIDNDDAYKACQKDLTKDEWSSGDYFGLMQDLLYAGPSDGDQFGDGWNFSTILTDGNTEPELRWKKADKSVVEVIRSWATRVDEFQCTDKNFNAGCNSLDLGSKENCENVEDNDAANLPQAVGMLKAIANFANAMTDATGTIEDIRDSIKTKGLDIHKTFNLHPDDFTTSSAGPLGYTSAYIIAATFAGLIPGAGGLIGLPLNLMVGANLPFSTKAYEPKFDRQMEFEGFVDETTSNIVETIRRALQMGLNDAPNIEGDDIKQWIDGPGSLRQILKDGNYADAKSQAIGDEGRSNMEKILYSFAINREWKQSNIFVVRIDKDQAEGMGFDPNNLCGDPTDNVPLGKQDKYCDDGSILFVMRWNWAQKKMGIVGVEKLGDYNIDLRDVARNSWDWQQVNGFSNGEDKAEENSKKALEIGINGDDSSKLQHWSLPVCDIGTSMFPDGNTIKGDNKACEDAKDKTLCALFLNSICRCTKIDGWPYGNAPWPPMPVVSLFSDPDVDPETLAANAWIDACAEAFDEDRKKIQGKQEDLDDP